MQIVLQASISVTYKSPKTVEHGPQNPPTQFIFFSNQSHQSRPTDSSPHKRHKYRNN